MAYKILHFADLHLDASFVGQGFPGEYGVERRLSLNATLTGILAKARELKVDAVTIGGDLFVQELLLPETSDFILQQLSLLAPIRVIISPGEADPFTNESIYARMNWPDNVDIFYQSKLSHIELAPNIHLWGACNPPARGQKIFEDFKLSQGINLLLLHAIMDRPSDRIHSVSPELVQKAGFNLALLGGKHVGDDISKRNTLCIFPGSPEPLDPIEENGLHQAFLIEIEDQVNIQALPLQKWHYRTIDVDLSDCTTSLDATKLITQALEAEITQNPQSVITIVLKGIPHFDFNLTTLRQNIQVSGFFRIESHFEIGYDLEQLAHEQTVRGLLVKRFLGKIRATSNRAEQRQLLTALNFALTALDGKQVSLYEVEKG